MSPTRWCSRSLWCRTYAGNCCSRRIGVGLIVPHHICRKSLRKSASFSFFLLFGRPLFLSYLVSVMFHIWIRLITQIRFFFISKYKCKQNLCRSCFVIVFYSNFIKVSFYKIVFSIKFFSKGIEISIFFTRNLTSWVASSFKLLTVIY